VLVTVEVITIPAPPELVISQLRSTSDPWFRASNAVHDAPAIRQVSMATSPRGMSTAASLSSSQVSIRPLSCAASVLKTITLPARA
jgi:hypothetical protein